MNLQFKPECTSRPASRPGYDVDLLNELALIGKDNSTSQPRLQRPDLRVLQSSSTSVSVGLSPTPERRRPSTSRAYAVRPGARRRSQGHGRDASTNALNTEGETITALAGSTGGADRAVPEREGRGVPRPERGVPRGRHGPRGRDRGRELPARAVQQARTARSSSRPRSRSRCTSSTARTPCRRATRPWRPTSREVHLPAAEERPARRGVQGDDRRTAAADAEVPLTDGRGGRPPRRRRRPRGRGRRGGGGSRSRPRRRAAAAGGGRSSSSQPGSGSRPARGADFLRGGADRRAERWAPSCLPRRARSAIRGDGVVLAGRASSAETCEAGGCWSRRGAHDRPVAFPGWTLPGVSRPAARRRSSRPSACCRQQHRVRRQRAARARLPGPAARLRRERDAVLEAGRRRGPRRVRLLAAARGNMALLRDAVAYRTALARARVPLRYRRIVVRAEGDGRVEEVVHAAADAEWRPAAGTEERVAADTLCVGYGFVPSVELLRLAGCDFAYDEDLGGPVVAVDEWRRTTVPGVLAAATGPASWGRTSRRTRAGSRRSAPRSTWGRPAPPATRRSGRGSRGSGVRRASPRAPRRPGRVRAGGPGQRSSAAAA